MSDDAKKVSEAKGPYRVIKSGGIWHVESVDGLCFAGLLRGDAETNCDIRNSEYRRGFKAGRASRDGLARALNDILEGGNDTSAWAFGVAKRALEADGGMVSPRAYDWRRK